MKKIFSLLLIVITSATLLSGCNIEDFFAKIATTPEEQGAREAFNRNQMLAQKQQAIDDKIKSFDTSIQLTSDQPDNTYQAYAFKSVDENETTIAIEALLPNPSRQVYEAWLSTPDNQMFHLGSLVYNQDEDYSLTYTTNEDLSSYSTLLISLESAIDETPETIILSGDL